MFQELILVFSTFLLIILTANIVTSANAQLTEIVASKAQLKTIDGFLLKEAQVNTDVIISVTLENRASSALPYIAIIEVRNKEGVTIFLQHQNNILLAKSSIDVNVSWIPNKLGDYQLRTFVLLNFTNPTVFSPVMRSEGSVGFIAIEDPKSVPRTETKGETEDQQSDVHKPSISQLKQFTLEKINEDRAKFHIPPVILSDNEAAQIHAEDVFRTKHVSHWTTNGEKPYMTYSKYEGTGDMSQNVAASGHFQYYEECKNGKFICEKLDPFQEMEKHQYGMMYKDEDCCENGHRYNILDKYHTHVSIGIAYDDYFVVMVQNFENEYITWRNEIDEDNPTKDMITMAGDFQLNKDGLSTNDIRFDGINIHYDPLPTNQTYEENRNKGYYERGELVASVADSLHPSSRFDHELIEAKVWKMSQTDFEISFSLMQLEEKYGDGVYTVTIWCTDEYGDNFLAAGISTFIQD